MGTKGPAAKDVLQNLIKNDSALANEGTPELKGSVNQNLINIHEAEGDTLDFLTKMSESSPSGKRWLKL